jgi:hypothetical protein
MSWTVVYRSSAQDHLANIWLNAPDRQAVTDAADEIDRLLASDPLNAGESRGGNTRIIVERPLTALYDVFPDDALVEVFAVFHWRRRRQ